MLEGLKRWISGSGADRTADTQALKSWADSRQAALRKPREGDGFIVDGRLDEVAWRLEWGPSQRPYVNGHELRIRAELRLPSDLQVLVLNKALQDALEKAVFDQYIEGVQTRIDTQTPPELRWLVMFPKLSGSELGGLRDRWAAVTGSKPWLMAWLDGPLTQALATLRVDPATPLVLMIGRGRLTLRSELPDPDPRDVEPLLRLFETALRELRRVGAEDAAGPESSRT